MSKLRNRPRLDISDVGKIQVDDQRSVQAASVLQMHDFGRRLVAEVFEGFGLPQNKADAILVARSRIADQWGKAKHAALLIGQTLLELSRALSEDEYRRLLTEADRLFEFSAALATKFRRAAELAEQLRLPPERLPGYTTLYDLACLGSRRRRSCQGAQPYSAATSAPRHRGASARTAYASHLCGALRS